MTRININLGLPQPGDILITRWNDERRNRSPGYFNHCSIFVGNNTVIEAVDKKGVISLSYPEFITICDRVKIVRLKIGKDKRQIMANTAIKYEGVRYRKMASIFFRLFKRTVNCTSLIRRCYIQATGVDPRWRRPDHVFTYPNMSYWTVK